MGPEPGIRSQHTVVAVAMDPRGRDELGEGLEELERREQQLGAAVDVGLGKGSHETGRAVPSGWE